MFESSNSPEFLSHEQSNLCPRDRRAARSAFARGGVTLEIVGCQFTTFVLRFYDNPSGSAGFADPSRGLASVAAAASAGKNTVNVLPWPGSLSILSWPR